jgi:hypothetical protein
MDIVAQQSSEVKPGGPIPWQGHEQALYYCATTKRWFRGAPGAFKYMPASSLGPGYVYVWVDCPFCDQLRHVRGQWGYDPTQPQPHIGLLKDAPEDVNGIS